MDTLVTTDWLAGELGAPDLVVLDCTVQVEEGTGGVRGVSGRPAYEAGHIPGAGFADLTTDLADPAHSQQFRLPIPERFCEAMGALGVGDDSRVVLYSDNMSVWAARVWWMLRWVGFDAAAILDGGLGAWTAEGRPVSTEPVHRAPKRLTPRPRPELIADRDDVRAAIGDGRTRIVDTFHEEHYRGDQKMYARPGHIAGAVNQPFFSLVDPSGRFRPLDELAELHDGNRDARTITYCGGGIMASSSAFVMTRLGFRDVALYVGSLEEWAADPDNPMEVGAGED
jgi:thiosulfate/3-mercaptopyruvate sulfurtransferase